MMKPGLLCGAIVALATQAAPGQMNPPPTVVPPNFQVSLRAAMIAAAGSSMAADRFGNVYILDQAGIGNGTITRIDSAGAATPGFVSGLGVLSQIASSPLDGMCYVASYSPLLPVVNSMIWRIDPNAGATQSGSVALIASGFAIDNDGMFYFGTQTGLQGSGLYRHDPSGPSGNATYLGPGFSSNAILQSLPSGDVLIAGGSQVMRWTPSAILPLPYYTHPPPMPNTIAEIRALARIPFNQIGAGALIAVREFTTVSFSGQGTIVAADMTGGNLQLFASEPYGQPYAGLRSIASGPRQEAWWFTDQPGPGPAAGKLLFRIEQQPAHGSQGSLVIDATPATLAFHVYGPAQGGDPFLAGAASTLLPVDLSWFAPPFGIIDLNPFHLLYIPLLDGVGLFGPPNSLAQTPPGGHWQLTMPAPPGGGVSLRMQALILAPGAAPNGYFFISNVALLILP